MKTGKVLLGQHATEDCINEGKAQLVVVARNCPERFQQFLAGKQDVSVHIFEGSGVQLGMACGKPFMVSASLLVVCAQRLMRRVCHLVHDQHPGVRYAAAD
jgi:large subunit ribosomal protein L30e